VSSLSIYNELVRRHPEHVARLMRGYYYDRRGDHAPGEPPVSPERIPVFSFHNGLLHCCYNRLNIDLAPAKTGEKLEPEDVAALDAVEAIAKDPEVHMKMVMNKGDMQFVNNFVTLHSRTEFADRPDGRARQLVRVWLDCPQGRRRGPSMLDLYTTSERRFNKFDAGA
jgi:hypothetical protein